MICDCHVHVLDPVRFAYAQGRAYTPGAATVEQLQAMHAAAGVRRTVLVQPSVYGFDNACLIDALAALGTERARGVAVVDLETIATVDLERLHAQGVRGLRLNFHVGHREDVDAATRQLQLARRMLTLHGWHLQIYASASLVLALQAELRDFPIPVVLDHFGGIRRPADEARELAAIKDLMQAGQVYTKITAPYFVNDVASLARELYDAAPDKVVWGSDWPHTGGGDRGQRDPARIEPFRPYDVQRALQDLASRLPAEAIEKMLVRNAELLYGF